MLRRNGLSPGGGPARCDGTAELDEHADDEDDSELLEDMSTTFERRSRRLGLKRRDPTARV